MRKQELQTVKIEHGPEHFLDENTSVAFRTKWTDRNRITVWMRNYALAKHLKDPRRFDVGPAHTSLIGWIYFRVLCGIKS